MKKPNYFIYANSVIDYDGTKYWLCKNNLSGEKKLAVQGKISGFQGSRSEDIKGYLCDLLDENTVELRSRLPWLNPVPLGLSKSFGFGDRLGLATPGHIEALDGLKIQPIFAQQSVRENARTGRSAKKVLNDAIWGIFQTGWKKPWGADGDHLKLPELINEFIDVGYSFYTVDPGDHVDHQVDHYSIEKLREKANDVSWSTLSTSLKQIYLDWVNKEIPSIGIKFDEHTILKALVKYGNAIIHSVRIYTALKEGLGKKEFDFEVSVDETETPTTIEEHFFIAHELKRLGVQWNSLAPRFVGRFEKGVDYIGDVEEFEDSLKGHIKVSEYFGNYKISLHSGSDKFSVYPLLNRYTKGKLHIKTAGTSYLEALRTIALTDPALFDEIFSFSRSRYSEDRFSYHVSAELDLIPGSVAERGQYLDEFNARQVFHVTYGSVLSQFGNRIFQTLRQNEQVYDHLLTAHFKHHLSLIS